MAEILSGLRELLPGYGSRGSLTDNTALLSDQARRSALLEQFGSVVEPYDPSLGEKIYNFTYDALGGNTATGPQKQRVQRWAGYPQQVIDQFPIAAFTDYSKARQDYARGDALSGTANMAMAATSFIPGQQRQAVDEVIKRITDGSFGRTLKYPASNVQVPFRSPISPQTDVPQIPFRPDTPVTNPSALRGVFSTTDTNAAGMTPNMINYQTAGILSRDPNYFKEWKDVDYEIRNMSPDEYLERGAKILRTEGRTPQDIIDQRAEDTDYIDKMVESMRQGQVYAAPYLDYGSGGRRASQEGMHRSLAARQLGMEEIPVMVLDSFENPKSPYRSALNEMDTPVTNPSALRELDLSYRGQHESPSADYGAPLHDLTQMIPQDVYGSEGPRLYGLGDNKVDAEVFSTLRAVKGLPDSEVVTYRAVPLDVNDINPGDWVTTSKEYAVQHGESALGGNYQILEQKAKAKDLFTAGDVQEYGWNPEGIKVIDNSFNRLSPPKNETLGELADRLGDIYKSNPNNRQFRLDWLDARKRRDSLGADILANP